ncbi:uncharacterized protein G2W53_003886 [Senna tora]|uniref:Uncharacterized protein n=1 Tax=Senna tora TaxID=362788 RepID=A0A834XEB0_9FABA|nr:uncharacterized protein G2W53_003886 [Senna tora]
MNNPRLPHCLPPPFAIANEATLRTQPCYSRVDTVNPLNSGPILPPSCRDDLAELKDLFIQGFKAMKDAIAAEINRAVQNAPPLVTSNEEEDFEPQSEIDLASDTLSYTQGSSETSFKSACSWIVTSDSSEDDNSQNPLRGTVLPIVL